MFVGNEKYNVKVQAGVMAKLQASTKEPGQFLLRLMDVLFSEEVLANSTVSGKNRPALDSNIMDAMKGNEVDWITADSGFQR